MAVFLSLNLLEALSSPKVQIWNFKKSLKSPLDLFQDG